MKTVVSIFLFSVLLDAKKCDSKKQDDIPACIQQLITDYANRPVQNPSAVFYEYDYKGQKVYYMKPPCCDQFSKLYDSGCNLICAPDGGITGKGDGKCPDFFTERSNEKVIWKDSRQ